MPMKHTFFILCILLLSVTGLRAVGTDQLLNEGFMTPDGLVAHLHELGLSPEQEQKIRTIVSEAHVRADSLGEVLHEKQRQFDRLLQDPATKTDVATAELGKVLEAEAMMKMLVVTTLLDVRHQLTPGQLTKALELAKAEVEKNVPIEKRMSAKADKLRAAFRWLGNDPPAAFTLKGEEIEKLIKEGSTEKANSELDQLIEAAGLNEPAGQAPMDFSKADPGKTDLDSLIARFDRIKAKALATTSLPLLRQLQKAHEEFEVGRSLGDAVRIGRVLTVAEGLLEIKP